MLIGRGLCPTRSKNASTGLLRGRRFSRRVFWGFPLRPFPKHDRNPSRAVRQSGTKHVRGSRDYEDRARTRVTDERSVCSIALQDRFGFDAFVFGLLVLELVAISLLARAQPSFKIDLACTSEQAPSAIVLSCAASQCPVGWCTCFPMTCARRWSSTLPRSQPGRTSRPWLATNSSAGSRMPSNRRPANAAFAEPRRSWRKGCVGPAAGLGAATANATPGSDWQAILAADPTSSLTGDQRSRGYMPTSRGGSIRIDASLT